MARTQAPADKIMFQLKMRGPQMAAQVARRLGVTAMAVRQQLYQLQEQGLVEFSDEKRPVGRPARLWRLADKGAQRFPDAHADLTVELIGTVRKTLGEKALQRLISARGAEQLAQYRKRLTATGSSIESRVAELAKIRSEQGYMAESGRERDGTLTLVENHCPICAAARECQGFCRDELETFRQALGPGVAVERTEHILSGARRCAYRITAAKDS